VTPLVDVTLVVLIIFMVVAPMLTKTFSLSIPPEAKDEAPVEASDQPLVMTLDSAGVMRLNRQVVDPADLPQLLPPLIAGAKSKVLHFDADDSVPYGDVVAAVDKCRDAGARSIAIVTKKIVTD
jgi:biopolymer transport protein ExbD